MGSSGKGKHVLNSSESSVTLSTPNLPKTRATATNLQSCSSASHQRPLVREVKVNCDKSKLIEVVKATLLSQYFGNHTRLCKWTSVYHEICHSVGTIQIEHSLIRRICNSDLDAEESWGSSSIWFNLFVCNVCLGLSWYICWTHSSFDCLHNMKYSTFLGLQNSKTLTMQTNFKSGLFWGSHRTTLSQMDWPGQCIKISKYNGCCKIWPNIYI